MKIADIFACVVAASAPLVSAAPAQDGDLMERQSAILDGRSFEAPGLVEARSPNKNKDAGNKEVHEVQNGAQNKTAKAGEKIAGDENQKGNKEDKAKKEKAKETGGEQQNIGQGKTATVGGLSITQSNNGITISPAENGAQENNAAGKEDDENANGNANGNAKKNKQNAKQNKENAKENSENANENAKENNKKNAKKNDDDKTGDKIENDAKKNVEQA